MTVLFVLLMILFFLLLDWGHRKVVARGMPQAVTAEPAHAMNRSPRIPGGIFFSKSHTWLNLFPSGTVRLGIDDFVNEVIGRPHITLLHREGTMVRKGDPLAHLGDGDRSLTVFSPIDGEIVGVNDGLGQNPDLMLEKPFSDGWAYTIAPHRLSDLKTLLLGPETQAWMRNEFRRLRDFFAGAEAGHAPELAVLQDGGLPATGALQSMDERTWEKFQQTFLQPE